MATDFHNSPLFALRNYGQERDIRELRATVRVAIDSLGETLANHSDCVSFEINHTTSMSANGGVGESGLPNNLPKENHSHRR